MAVFATLNLTAGADKTLSWAAAKPQLIFGEGDVTAVQVAWPAALSGAGLSYARKRIVGLRLLPLNIKL